MKKLLAFVVAFVVHALLFVAFGALWRDGATLSRAAKVEPLSEAQALPGAARAPVLVELFTSEGCSSCPPADALLSRLEKTQPVEGAEVIAVAQHVDYWNYLGWRDPFSYAEAGARQREYAGAFAKDGVYTPQMIVDGRTEFPGGKQSLAFETIAKAARTPKAEVVITRLASDAQAPGVARLGVSVRNLPPVAEGDTADVLLAITESDLATSVARGENEGRRLSHVGVARRLGVVGSATAGTPFAAETEVNIEGGWRRENLRVVVFVQERAGKRVLGAATIKLNG
jgi:hypothetical protein